MRPLTMIMGFTAMILSSTAAEAQKKTTSAKPSSTFKTDTTHTQRSGVDEMLAKRIQVKPEVIQVDIKAGTASITFVNPTTDSLRAELSVRHQAPPKFVPPAEMLIKDTGEWHGNKDTATTVIDTTWSLASWIKDLPPRVTLGPKATKTITLRIDVPSNAKTGEYSGYVVVNTLTRVVASDVKEQLQAAFTAAGYMQQGEGLQGDAYAEFSFGESVVPRTSGKLVLRVGSTSASNP